MQDSTTLPWGGVVTGAEFPPQLPLGCQKCVRGEKLVVFLTGICNANCFYCPISQEKKNKDIFQANERKIASLEDIINEARLSSATSASFTGGDPFLVLSKLKSTGDLLKQSFNNFHIHAYTTGRNCTIEALDVVSNVIDELRFHPMSKSDLDGLQNALSLIDSSNWTVGLEVPANREFHQKSVFKKAARILDDSIKNSDNAAFININELEVSETNYRQLLKKGYKVKRGSESIVEGSELSALAALKNIHSNYPDITIHYCPVATKDSVQLPNRLYKRARNIALPSDYIIEEGVHRGLLIRGVIKTTSVVTTLELANLRKKLVEEFDIPDEMISIDKEKMQILTVPGFVEENCKEIKNLTEKELVTGMVEEYPTVDRLQTSFIEFN
ncbi:MAG: 4Fe-4S cluster-binding domain-containing protein [Candidatus Hodarchaeales archaeon]|jgi:pyruvate formate-lyase activating enzyme-like uncharacterized protein